MRELNHAQFSDRLRQALTRIRDAPRQPCELSGTLWNYDVELRLLAP